MWSDWSCPSPEGSMTSSILPLTETVSANKRQACNCSLVLDRRFAFSQGLVLDQEGSP